VFVVWLGVWGVGFGVVSVFFCVGFGFGVGFLSSCGSVWCLGCFFFLFWFCFFCFFIFFFLLGFVLLFFFWCNTFIFLT